MCGRPAVRGVTRGLRLGLLSGALIWASVATGAIPATAGDLRQPACRGDPATIVGSSADDTLIGTAGPDVIVGGGGADEINGGAGDDLICGGPGPDLLYGDAGDDRLFGGDDNDWFEDTAGANHLDGGAGADHFASGPGDDTIVGGPGEDTAGYVRLLDPSGWSSHCNAITANLSEGTGGGDGFGLDTLVEVEDLASGGGNDVLVGDAGPNTFYTGLPCYGARHPVESVTGGDGSDRISFAHDQFGGSNAPGPVRVDLARQLAWLTTQSTLPTVVITLDSIENATGTSDADILLGDAGPNVLISGPWSAFGVDVIRGRGGDDRLLGFRGAQRLYGGGGADDLSGGGSADRLDGGPGRNHNDGGLGIDTCRRPTSEAGAIDCER